MEDQEIREEPVRMHVRTFELECLNPRCGWSGTRRARTGHEAIGGIPKGESTSPRAVKARKGVGCPRCGGRDMRATPKG